MDRAALAKYASWGLAAVVLVAVGLTFVRGEQGGAAPAPVKLAGPQPKARRAPPRAVFVSVTGEVARPGLVRVPSGARAAEALERAGGPTRRGELTGINLAARLHDGQSLVVPRRGGAAAPAAAGSAPSGAATGAPSGSAPGQKVSLASATLEQLDTLDGIGPTLARRIVEYRDRHGGFRSLEELRQVEGIGDKRFESLRAALDP